MRIGSLRALVAVWLVPTLVLADADPPPAGAFTLVVLPDTQTYTQLRNLNEIFLRQTQWIAEHKESHDIRYVLHVGDVVQNNSAPEWEVAKQAFLNLDDAEVPYAISPGNHDYGPGGSAANRQTLFNNYFGNDSEYGTQPSLGGFFEPGRSESSFHTFRVGEHDWIILALEWGPRNSVVEWADQVLRDHPDHRGIVITHAYMYSDDTRYDFKKRGAAQSWNPHTYGTANDPDGTNDGQELWDKLVSRHNIVFVFSGHVLNDGTGRLMSIGKSGQSVHQLLANYQSGVTGSTNGGNGFMRLVQVVPDDDIVHIRTYSPYVDRYKTEPDQEFSLALCDLPSDPELDSSVCDVVASFTVAPEVGEAPLVVQLDASASTTREGRSIVSFVWDLGDGTTADGSVATHEYVRGGRYVIRLEVTDDRGLSATTERTVRVSCPAEKGDVSPWSAVDIGDVLLPGRTKFERGGDESCLSSCATGRFLTGSEDDFHFVYQQIAGDVGIATRITRVEGAASGAQVGVMLREGLEPDARFFAMTLRRTRTSTRFRFQYRAARGASIRSKAVSSGREVPPAWVKVERRGDEGVGYVSADGVEWEEVQRHEIPELSGAAYAGIVAIGNEPADDEGFDPVNGAVCDMELTGVERVPLFLRGDCNGDATVNIADAACALDWLFAGSAKPGCVASLNTNGSIDVDVLDPVALLNFLFVGGPAPVAPFPACGAGELEADVALGCEEPAC